MARRAVVYVPEYEWATDPELRKQLQNMGVVPDSVVDTIRHLELERSNSQRTYLDNLRRSRITIEWHNSRWGEDPIKKRVNIRCCDKCSIELHDDILCIRRIGYRCVEIGFKSPIWDLVMWALTDDHR